MRIVDPKLHEKQRRSFLDRPLRVRDVIFVVIAFCAVIDVALLVSFR